MKPTTSRNIAVIGGGISGLTTALRLAEQGHAVTLIEGSGQLGGLGTFFEHDGRTFEKFYHCMLPSDGPLLELKPYTPCRPSPPYSHCRASRSYD